MYITYQDVFATGYLQIRVGGLRLRDSVKRPVLFQGVQQHGHCTVRLAAVTARQKFVAQLDRSGQLQRCTCIWAALPLFSAQISSQRNCEGTKASLRRCWTLVVPLGASTARQTLCWMTAFSGKSLAICRTCLEYLQL